MKRKTLDRIGLLFVALVMISPVVLFFLWMISLSLKYEIDNGAYPPIFIPERFAWSNYVKVFEENNFFLYLWNSLLVTGSATLLALLIGVPAGYGIARLKDCLSAMESSLADTSLTRVYSSRNPMRYPPCSSLIWWVCSRRIGGASMRL